ncbi:MAG: gliding motility-associated C-terminal domain-containing protein [Bacteroidales bacterium]|nr:gliding motility-associated C-terminal domain-containing protein [Bacteroidales bacterium]
MKMTGKIRILELKRLLLALFVLVAFGAVAQNVVVMENADSLVVDGCFSPSGVIYDDGGLLGAYSVNFSGSVTIKSSPGTTITLIGNYNTENGYDKLTVSDGTTLLLNQVSGSGTVDVSSTTGLLVVSFTTDPSVTRDGFELEWTVSGGSSMCANPVGGLDTVSVGTTTIGLEWTADNAAGPFTLTYGNQRVDGITATSYTLTGLNPSSAYDITVTASANEGNNCCADGITVRTRCGEVSEPYVEGFEGLDDGAFPPCWIEVVNFDDEEYLPQAVASHRASGRRSLMISSGNSAVDDHFSLVATPSFASVQTVTMHMNLRSSHAGAVVEMGECNATGSDYDLYGFTPLQTIVVDEVSHWEVVSLQWTPSAPGRRLAFRMVQSQQPGVGVRVYIDDLEMEGCGVESLQASQVEHDQLLLSWSEFGSPVCKVGVRRTAQSVDSVTIDPAASPQLVTGLSPQTQYTLTVYPSCGAVPSVAHSVNVRTAALPEQADGYCSQFEQGTWTSRVIAARYDNWLTTEDGALSMWDGASGSSFFLTSERLLGLPGKQVGIAYWGENNNARIIVGTTYYPDDKASFVPLDTLVSDGLRHNAVVNVPAGSTGRHIAILVENPTWYVSLKIFSVICGTSLVDDVRLVHRRGTTMAFAWAEAYDTVLVQHGLKGFELGTGVVDTFLNAASGTVAGLLPSTDYDFVFYRPGTAPCGNSRRTIRTATRDYPLPYCEDFKALDEQDWASDTDGDWKKFNSLNDAPDFAVGYYADEPKSLHLTSWGFNWDYYTTAVLPDVELDGNTVLSFYAFDQAPQSKLVVGIIDEECVNIANPQYGGLHFRPIDTIDVQALGQRRHYVWQVPAADSIFSARLALRYMHDYEYSYYGIYINELQFSHMAYANATATHIGFDSINIQIDALVGADSVEVAIVGMGDSLVYRCGPDDMDKVGIGGLDTGGYYYRVLVRPLEEGCNTYAFYLTGFGRGHAFCFPFDDLLYDELPLDWTATGVAGTGFDDALHVAPHSAVSMHPMQFWGGQTLSFKARSNTQGDTLLLAGKHGAVMEMIDTIVLDTVWRFYSYTLPTFDGDTAYVTFVAGDDTLRLDDVGVSSCPQMDMAVEGNRIVLIQDVAHDYRLYLDDAAGTDHREIYVNENPYVVEGLLMGTEYTVEWECLYTTNGCPQAVTVRTGDTVRLPYCEEFELPSGMVKVPPTWSFVSPDGGNHVSIDMWGPSVAMLPSGNWMYAILPPLDADSVMSLTATLYNWEEGAVEIGVLGSGVDTSTFITLWRSEGDWNYPAVDMSNYADKRVALRARKECRIFRLHVYNIPMATIRLVRNNTWQAVTPKKAPYWLHVNPLDTLVAISDTLFQIVYNDNSLRFYQACDSLGYTCDSEREYLSGFTKNMPYCYDAQEGYSYPWYRFVYYSRNRYGSVKMMRHGNAGRYYMRLDGNGSTWVLAPDFVNIDSIRHAGMRIYYYAPSEADSLEVGVMTDAYDTSTFTPLDTLVYTIGDGSIQSAYVDLSRYTGDGRWVAMHHMLRARSEYFDIASVYFDSCTASMGAEASLWRWNRVKIDGPHTPFYMEYYPAGTSYQGNSSNPVVRVDTVPMILTLQPETRYEFFFRCDSLGSTCVPAQQVTTLAAPMDVPSCVDFDTLEQGSVPRGWTLRNSEIGVTDAEAHSDTNSLRMPIGVTSYAISPDLDVDSIGTVALSIWYKVESLGDRLVVGVMSNPYDLATFHPVKTLAPVEVGTWQRGLVLFENAPQDAHFIALRARSNGQPGGRSIYVDDMHVSQCAAFDFTVSQLSHSSIDLTWTQVGQPDVTITMMDDDAVVGTYTNPSSPLHIEPLDALHYYSFKFVSTCGSAASEYCSTDYRDSLSVVAPAPGVGCVNATDLASPQAVFFSGSYSNPYSHAGAINHGPSHPDSRHTVCYDTAARDPRTGNLLRTIPEGYASSVRLGNWSTNYYEPEAEGVIYSLYVDTASFELLLLRYAAVLQDPMHAAADQPRFRLELLDTNYNIIDSACTSADFIADQSLGWNSADDGVLWKDWTAVGIDLSGHAGEQVYLRLTTYDCNEGSHYGYAYFTLECMRKNMNTEACGAVTENTLSAPEGFNYRWYTSENPSTVSTSQSITIPSEDITYYCEVSKLDNPDCNFTISTYGGTRYPMSSFVASIEVDSCRFHVSFLNTSAVSNDGVTPLPGIQCESTRWDFGNGTAATTYNGSAVYYVPGDYTVRLVSGLASDACLDTFEMVLHLVLPGGAMPTDTTEACICDNQTYSFFGHDYAVAGTYMLTLPVAGQSCDSLHVLHLSVKSTSRGDTTAVACDSLRWHGELYTTGGNHLSAPLGLNAAGCDTSAILHLTLHWSHNATVVDTIVQNELPYQVGNDMVTFTDLSAITPAYSRREADYMLPTYQQCDSTIALKLHVWMNRDTVLDTLTCHSQLPFTYHDTTLNPSVGLTMFDYLLATTHGADSVVSVHLTVRANPMASYHDTIVENELPHSFRTIVFNDAVDTSFFVNGADVCDSIVNYTLTVWHNSHHTLYDTVCDNQLPYDWFGHLFSGEDSITYTIVDRHGADSAVSLVLTVKPTFETGFSQVFCPYERLTYHGVEYPRPLSFDTTLISSFGCDSLVHVTLSRRSLDYTLRTLHRFDTSAFVPTDTMLHTCVPALLQLVDSTPTSVAWQWDVATPDTLYSSDERMVEMKFLHGSDSVAAYFRLVATDTIGCLDTLAWPVFAFATPTADFKWEPDYPAVHHPVAQFVNLSQPDTLQWKWRFQMPDAADDTSSAFSPLHSWGDDGADVAGDYEVSLVALWMHSLDTVKSYQLVWLPRQLYADFKIDPFIHTCTDTARHIVTVTNDYLHFPNLVTPNADGIDDTWEVVGLVEFGNYSENELWIYDRTGALVFHARNIRRHDQFWDPEATRSPDGTYYYRFSGKGENGLVKRNGVIEVLRD